MHIHDRVAKLCLKHFSSVVKKSKFKENEWTVLSCIVLEHPSSSDMSVVAFGTGSKCIGQTSMSERGDILNDSHAEVICRRSFLRYLYYEMLKCSDNESSVLEFDETLRKFKLKNARFHFFTTHVPCGDAAIFAKQNVEDFGAVLSEACSNEETSEKNTDVNGSNKVLSETFPNEEISEKITDVNNSNKRYGSVLSETCPNGETSEKNTVVNKSNKRQREGHGYENMSKKMCTKDIYRTGAKCLKNDNLQDLHLQGPEFHVTGAVRTKPGRGDPTLSVSCSDKIARWCCMGIQGALMSLLLTEPIYFTTFTIVGGNPFCKDALSRALYSKTESLELKKPYSVHKVQIGQAEDTFEFAKTSDRIPTPISIAWVDSDVQRQLEISVEGKKQGVTKKKINTESARLKICKVELFRMFLQVVIKFNIKLSTAKELEKMNYWDVKHLATEYQDTWAEVKKTFKIWTNKPIEYSMFRAF